MQSDSKKESNFLKPVLKYAGGIPKGATAEEQMRAYRIESSSNVKIGFSYF